MSGDTFGGSDEHRRALSVLGRMARAYLTGNVSSEQADESRRRFQENLERVSARSNSPRRTAWIAGAVLAAAAAVAVLVGRPFAQRPVLTFDVDAPVVSTRDYLLVPNLSPSGHLAFSDGSRVTLTPGTRGRIVALHADGAELGLEEGRASLDVVHRTDTRWLVGAGPFAVQVTGTSFDVRWSGADELFEVALRNGSVIVRGPLASEGIALSAGQRLIADLRANQLRIERLTDAPDETAATTRPAPSPSEEAKAPSLEGATREGAGRDRVAARSRTESSASKSRARVTSEADETTGWSKRVAAGDFRAVLAEAEQRGIEATLAERPLADLVALADAARYAGRSTLAKRALVAQRERFSTSSAARTAAFLLGRLAEGQGDGAGAVGWYDRYLSELPQGEFASEAVGRKMVTLEHTDGRSRARSAADEYLRRFPQGPYAAKARELTLAP